MKERKKGDKFILPKKCKVLEVTELDHHINCHNCYYYGKLKCHCFKCTPDVRKDDTFVYAKDITDTLSECDILLLERGLLKL